MSSNRYGTRMSSTLATGIVSSKDGALVYADAADNSTKSCLIFLYGLTLRDGAVDNPFNAIVNLTRRSVIRSLFLRKPHISSMLRLDMICAHRQCAMLELFL